MKLLGLKVIIILSVYLTIVQSRDVIHQSSQQRFTLSHGTLIEDSDEDIEEPAQQRQSFRTGQVRSQVNQFQQQGQLYRQQQQQQQLDKLIEQRQGEEFQQSEDVIQQKPQRPQQQTIIQSENLIQQSSVANLVSELRKEFLAWKEEIKTSYENLTKTVAKLENQVTQCNEELKVEQEEMKQISSLNAALQEKLELLENKMAGENCPHCVAGIQQQLTGLRESYQSTVPQLSIDVSSLQEKIQSDQEELEKYKKDTLGGFSSHAEIAQLLKQTSISLASTAQSFNTSAQIVMNSQKSQVNSCNTRTSEKLVKEDTVASLPLKTEIEKSDFNRLVRLVASKDALKTSAGYCPRQLGHNSNAVCSEIQKSCYCPVTSHAATWLEAERYCRWFGMTLATIESQEENDAVYALARSRGDNYYWIGATDRGHEGLWVWSATETPLGRYRNWANGQPDNSNGEDCMEFGNVFRNQWNDRPCNAPRNFICETTQTGSYIQPFPGNLIASVKSGLKA